MPGTRAAAGFELELSDAGAPLTNALDGLTLTVSSATDTHVVLDVHAQQAEALKGVYFRLTYDPQLYRPMLVEPAPAFGDKRDILSLLVHSGPGEIEYGQIMLHPEYRIGMAGDALLAQVSLRKMPALPRAASAEETTSASQLLDLGFAGTDRLRWSYALRGDYDQNGEVSIADLTPISQNYRAVSPDGGGQPFPFASALSQIDGDANGEINAGDLQAIAQNFRRNALGGFKVFRSADVADVPVPATAANGPGAVEVTAAFQRLSTAQNAALRGTERLMFEAALDGPVSGDFYWVRAVDGAGAVGIATEHHISTVQFPVSLTPSTPAEGGSGTVEDPFVFVADRSYSFTLLDGPDGADLSNHPATTFAVQPAEAGSFAGNSLQIGAGFEGGFVIEPSFNGLPLDEGELIYAQSAMPSPAPLIFPDPADSDWATVTGNGETSLTQFILANDTFNTDQEMEFTLQATAGEGGAVIPNADLTWDAFPPFTVQSAVSFECTGVFQIFQFANGYLFAQDALMRNSNELWVATAGLPN